MRVLWRHEKPQKHLCYFFGFQESLWFLLSWHDYKLFNEKRVLYEFVQNIRNVYTFSTTSTLTNNFTSDKIGIKKSKQGGPVSPLLFNLFLEPLIKNLDLTLKEVENDDLNNSNIKVKYSSDINSEHHFINELNNTILK